MNQQTKEELIERWLEDNISEEELLKSIPAEEVNQYKKILETVDNWVPQGGEEEPNRLAQVLATSSEAKVVSINKTSWIVSIAASIALIAAVVFIFLNKSEKEYYAEKEDLEVLLPDGSTTVTLSQGARLSYDGFTVENREVEIEGRVYFDVTEKGPFKVNYENGSISVLGTQFEIVKYEAYFEASCFEGSVKVNYQSQDAIMTEFERVLYTGGSLPKIQIRHSKPGWTEGKERFENDELVKIIKVIETRYEVSINAEAISLDRKFTGTMATDDLDSACKSVFSTLGINYQIQNKTIILSE